MAYKMSPRKIIDVLKYLTKHGIIAPHTASYIGAAYIDTQLDLHNENRSGKVSRISDSSAICPTCKQQVLPF